MASASSTAIMYTSLVSLVSELASPKSMSSPLLRLILPLRVELLLIMRRAGLLLLLLIVYIWLNVEDSEHDNECEHADEHDDLNLR